MSKYGFEVWTFDNLEGYSNRLNNKVVIESICLESDRLKLNTKAKAILKTNKDENVH